MSAPEPRQVRVLIVDDEPLARDFLARVLSGEAGVEVVGACDGVEALALIPQERPDLLLLDVQMPEVGGFELIERLGPRAMPEVIFVTAHEQYTLRAFEVHALDYVVKPFDPDRLRAAVAHARERLTRGAPVALPERLGALLEELARPQGAPRAFARRLTVRERDRISFVRVEEVDWIEAAGNYVSVHAGEATHLIRLPLRALLERLDPALFLRIHRGAVVNLDRVREVQPWSGGDYVAVLRSGARLRVSRTYADQLLRLVH